ncbi:MAG: hypothetical protein AAF974_03420 [Cyanobacteria bacterium P01_E01_bin.34]
MGLSITIAMSVDVEDVGLTGYGLTASTGTTSEGQPNSCRFMPVIVATA